MYANLLLAVCRRILTETATKAPPGSTGLRQSPSHAYSLIIDYLAREIFIGSCVGLLTADLCQPAACALPPGLHGTIPMSLSRSHSVQTRILKERNDSQSLLLAMRLRLLC